MNAYERLLLPENLNYAWRKAKTIYRLVDGYFDSGEIGEFELDLELRLRRIQKHFEKGSYRLSKLRPLPRPKKIGKEQPIDRQYYHVAIDDQVAWIAVANALGPELDQLMPPWSYGNRMYRLAWYKEDEHQRSKLEIGPYRHESGHLYRKFQHSWPLFRRHVALTAKAMVRGEPLAYEDLDHADQLAVASAHSDRLSYLRAHFWNRSATGSSGTDLYHASIDLKQFYPSIKSAAVLRGFCIAGNAVDESDPMRTVLEDMLRFRLDKAEMTAATLKHVEPQYGGKQVRGIPTGLFVAGFLANVAMLPIDKVVNQRIEARRSIAHFRFVDDHTFLAYDFDELCEWIGWYRDLLNQYGTGLEVNNEKYDPETLSTWMDDCEIVAARQKARSRTKSKKRQREKEAAIRDSTIDGANPTQLLTKTLGQVSEIAATHPDILDDEDLEDQLKLLEWLLLADIPEREIRPDTRAAFAAGKIATLAPILIQETDGLIDAARALASLKSRTPRAETATDEAIRAHWNEVQKKEEQVKELSSVHSRSKRRHLKHCFDMLLQAFREYPGKARLFFRLHQYCRVTGYKGLSSLAEWIKETGKRKHNVWAEYYAGLSLHILAVGIPFAARSLNGVNALRTDKEAALDHLDDVASIDTAAFLIPRAREAWFHAVARREFGVALLSVSNLIDENGCHDQLAERLNKLAAKCIRLSFKTDRREWQTETGRLRRLGSEWQTETGRLPGVWAHLIESSLSVDEKPSSVWRLFEPCLSYSKSIDRQAARRYPELLSDRGWNYFASIR